MITNEDMDFIDFLMNTVFDGELLNGNLFPDWSDDKTEYEPTDAYMLLDIYDMSYSKKYNFPSRKKVDKTFINLLTDNMNFFFDEYYPEEKADIIDRYAELKNM